MEIKVSEAQNIWLVFKETPFTKEGCTDLHTPDINKVKWVWEQLRPVMLWEFFFLYLSSVKLIPETESI